MGRSETCNYVIHYQAVEKPVGHEREYIEGAMSFGECLKSIFSVIGTSFHNKVLNNVVVWPQTGRAKHFFAARNADYMLVNIQHKRYCFTTIPDFQSGKQLKWVYA